MAGEPSAFSNFQELRLRADEVTLCLHQGCEALFGGLRDDMQDAKFKGAVGRRPLRLAVSSRNKSWLFMS